MKKQSFPMSNYHTDNSIIANVNFITKNITYVGLKQHFHDRNKIHRIMNWKRTMHLNGGHAEDNNQGGTLTTVKTKICVCICVIN